MATIGRWSVCAILLVLLALADPAVATPITPGPNLPPPGGALLDLAGLPLPADWTLYTADFTATLPTTTVTFAFRNDAGFTGFDNASIVDLTAGSSSNLVANGGFETGDLTGWEYKNPYGSTFNGFVASAAAGCPGYGVAMPSWPAAGGFGWCDGSTQAYDAIDQAIATIVGHVYRVAFSQVQVNTNLIDESVYQVQSTNTCDPDIDTRCAVGTLGNGVDTLVYVGARTPEFPQPVPEPASMILVGSGLIVAVRRIMRHGR